MKQTLTETNVQVLKILDFSVFKSNQEHLKFGNVAWSPRREKNINLNEGVQRQTTKLIPAIKDLEYEERLKRMGLPSVRYKRARGDMIDTYKYAHSKCTVNEDFLVRNKDSVARGHSLKLQK